MGESWKENKNSETISFLETYKKCFTYTKVFLFDLFLIFQVKERER